VAFVRCFGFAFSGILSGSIACVGLGKTMGIIFMALQGDT
jgi:hypothetical protein